MLLDIKYLIELCASQFRSPKSKDEVNFSHYLASVVHELFTFWSSREPIEEIGPNIEMIYLGWSTSKNMHARWYIIGWKLEIYGTSYSEPLDEMKRNLNNNIYWVVPFQNFVCWPCERVVILSNKWCVNIWWVTACYFI